MSSFFLELKKLLSIFNKKRIYKDVSERDGSEYGSWWLDPDPVNLNLDPVNLNLDPVNLNLDPVNLNLDPQVPSSIR